MQPPDLFIGADIAVQEAIRGYCGWHIAPIITETVTVDGSGGCVQLLPTLRLVDLVSISNDGTVVTDPEWSENGAVRGHWTGKLRGVTATITHGHVWCPADLEAVANRLERAEKMAGLGPVRIGQVSVQSNVTQLNSTTPAFDPYVQLILDRYKLPPRP